MASNVVVFGFGAILLLVAILGGGFELKDLNVPKVGWVPRVVAGFAGMCFVYWGVAIPASNQDKVVQALAAAVETRSRPPSQGDAKERRPPPVNVESVDIPPVGDVLPPKVVVDTPPNAPVIAALPPATAVETPFPLPDQREAEEYPAPQVHVTRVDALPGRAVLPSKVIVVTPPKPLVIASLPHHPPVLPSVSAKLPASRVAPPARYPPHRSYASGNGSLKTGNGANGKVIPQPLPKHSQMVGLTPPRNGLRTAAGFMQPSRQQLVQQQRINGQRQQVARQNQCQHAWQRPPQISGPRSKPPTEFRHP